MSPSLSSSLAGRNRPKLVQFSFVLGCFFAHCVHSGLSKGNLWFQVIVLTVHCFTDMLENNHKELLHAARLYVALC